MPPPRTADARAEQLLPYYLGLGTERTLPMMAKVLGAIGIKIDVRTLKTYSARHNWVARAREFDHGRLEAMGTMAVVQDAIASDARHAALGRAMQQLAVQAIAKRNNDRDFAMSGAEISTLAEKGVHIERLASGQATEIVAVMEDVYRGVVANIGQSFRMSQEREAQYFTALGLTPEQISEGQRRAMEDFVQDVDRMIQNHWVRSGFLEGSFVEGEKNEDQPQG